MTTPTRAQRQLVNEHTINAPIDAVWKAISDADELVRGFPLECRITPGVGGAIWFSWKNMSIGEAKIEIWEPQRRLRTSWEMPSPDGSGAMVRISDEYTLESKGAQTSLRLVSTGFGKDASWDGMYDCVRRGWNFELRGLTNYLELHRGEPRAVAWVQQKVSMPLNDMLDRLLGPDGLNATPSRKNLAAGAKWQGTNVDGEGLTGEVLHFDPTGLCVIRLDQWNGALLRIEHETSAPGEFGGLWLWFSIYGEDPALVEALERAWKERCARLFG
jgi:uncharacterized protein YndB with AHSA1/START domain